MDDQNWLTLDQAGKIFPKPLSAQTIRKRILKGIKGGKYKLRATWTGSCYLTRTEWVEERLQQLQSRFTEHVRIVPIEQESSRLIQMMRDLARKPKKVVEKKPAEKRHAKRNPPKPS